MLPFPDPSPKRLLTGNPGSGLSSQALSALDSAVDAHGADRALLLLPTYGDVEHARRVALSRRNVGGLLDAPFSTFTSLGERLLPGTRVGALPTRVERDLLAGEALRLADVPAFRRVRDRRGFRARFLRLVKEMKQTGEDPSECRRRARATLGCLGESARERWAGFLDAWERYDERLAHAGIVDHEDALRALLDRVRSDPTPALSGLRFFGADGFDDLTGLEERLLLACAQVVSRGGGSVLVTLALDEGRPVLFRPAIGLRDRLRAAGFAEERPAPSRRPEEPLPLLAARLFGAAGERVDAGDGVRALVGADPRDEVERIAREIRRLVDRVRSDLPPRRRGEGPLAFRDVGVVFRRLDGIGAVAKRTFEALGVPTRLASGGVRLASEPIVRAFRGPLAVLAGGGTDGRDFDAARVLDWLRWRALASGDPLPVDLVDAADMRWRREGFPPDWSAFVSSSDPPRWREVLGEVEAARAACARAVGPDEVYGALVEAAERLLPLEPPGPLDASGRPLDPEGDDRLRRAAHARRLLLEVARGLRAASRRTDLFPDLRVDAAAAQWLDSLEEATFSLPDRRLEAVTLLDAEEARHYDLPVVFVAGLVEKEFPLQPREDVFLHDDDRAALLGGGVVAHGDALRTARADEERERRLLLQAVASARRRLYLCRHAADEDGREKAPSLLWREVDDVLFGPGKDRRPGPLCDRNERVQRAAPTLDEALCERDLERLACARLGEPTLPGGDEARLDAVALARAGGPRAAALLRRAARFRRLAEDPLGTEHFDAVRRAVERVSPTGVTTGLRCRHRFFLSKVLRLPEDDAPVAGRQFDRRDLGSIVHEALRCAVEFPSESPEAVAVRALGTSRSAELAADTPLRSAVEADLTRVVRLFRSRERAAAASGFRPYRTELSFGREGDPEVALGDGEGRFLLEGTIDRVDVLEEDGRLVAVVLDYKLGKSTATELVKDTASGEDLQLGLYARAVEVAWGIPVVGVEGYAASARRRAAVFDSRYATRFAFRVEGTKGASTSAEAFREMLSNAERLASDVVRSVRDGGASAHRKAPLDPEKCDECGHRSVCRPDVFGMRRPS